MNCKAIREAVASPSKSEWKQRFQARKLSKLISEKVLSLAWTVDDEVKRWITLLLHTLSSELGLDGIDPEGPFDIISIFLFQKPVFQTCYLFNRNTKNRFFETCIFKNNKTKHLSVVSVSKEQKKKS